MATEMKFVESVRTGDKILVDGKALTVSEREAWDAEKVSAGREKLRLYEIHFEPFHTTTNTVHPRSLFVPGGKVVAVEL